MHKIGIVYNHHIPSARTLGESLSAFLSSRTVQVWLHSLAEAESLAENMSATDMILTIGGDGTILRIARSAAPWSIPIVGINMGTIGFLTEIKASEALEKIPLFLEDKAWIDERAMLQVEVALNTNLGGKEETIHALNDVVLGRGEIPRLIRIKAILDDVALATYRTDGIIVATATGSTAYSLANRGPIIYPQSRDIILMPVSPYMCLNHPLVLSSSTNITLQLEEKYSGVLSIDGQVNIKLPEKSLVQIKNSPYRTRLLRICPRNSFYQLLEQKLKEK